MENRIEKGDVFLINSLIQCRQLFTDKADCSYFCTTFNLNNMCKDLTSNLNVFVVACRR